MTFNKYRALEAVKNDNGPSRARAEPQIDHLHFASLLHCSIVIMRVDKVDPATILNAIQRREARERPLWRPISTLLDLTSVSTLLSVPWSLIPAQPRSLLVTHHDGTGRSRRNRREERRQRLQIFEEKYAGRNG